MRTKRKLLLSISMLLVFGGGIFLYFYLKNGEVEYVFSTSEVERTSINNAITATGTLEATNTVVVGTQVSGVIEKIYVDFNSKVKKGQLIAELDKSTLMSSLLNSQADLEKAQANFEYQEAQYQRNKGLFEKEFMAASEFELNLYNYKISKAEVKSSQANLSRAERNLSYASIYSPIDGLVLNRAVEEGQTVTASMNTPELFTITNDLSTMQVEANIDEADIGQLELNQRVEFTVDAFPDITFDGSVSEMRLQPNESSNVITYTTIVTVDNPEFKLKPGMTANISIFIEEANDVLVIPSKATRFTPNHQLLEAYRSSLAENKPSSESENKRGNLPPGPPRDRDLKLDDSHKRIWVKEGDLIHPIIIETGIDDGSNLEVISGLEEGSLIVTSFEANSQRSFISLPSSSSNQKSPFVQERPKRQGGGGPGGPPH